MGKSKPNTGPRTAPFDAITAPPVTEADAQRILDAEQQHGEEPAHDDADGPGQPQAAEGAGPQDGTATGAAAEHETPAAGEPAAPAGEPVYEREWNLCLTLAFAGTGLDMLTDWGAVPFEMAMFARANRAAPHEACLIHIQRKFKVTILPDQDPRRVELAIALFRRFVDGIYEIAAEDDEALHVALLRAEAERRGPPHIAEEDRAFVAQKGPFDDLSGLGQALTRKAD